MSIIDIRKLLKKIDYDTSCKYDLLTMYDSCLLSDIEKKEFAELLAGDYEEEEIYNKLSKYFQRDCNIEKSEDIYEVPYLIDIIISDFSKRTESEFDKIRYNNAANQIEFEKDNVTYTIGISPSMALDNAMSFFIDENYDDPINFESIDDAVDYIVKIAKNKIQQEEERKRSDIEDDTMIFKIYDIVENDDRLVVKCINESTNSFEDIKLGKINSQKVNELLNNLLNNPNFKITDECKEKIAKNSAPWGLAVQMTPSVDISGTNALLSTGDFSGNISFGESCEEKFEKDDRVTDGTRQGTVIDCDQQKVLIEWDYSDR